MRLRSLFDPLGLEKRQKKMINSPEAKATNDLLWTEVARVYGFYCKVTNLVKIGHTGSPVYVRLKAIGGQSPTALEVTGFTYFGDTRGAALFERFLHKVLATERSHGEWFRYTPRTRQVLAKAFEVTPTAPSGLVHGIHTRESREALCAAIGAQEGDA